MKRLTAFAAAFVGTSAAFAGVVRTVSPDARNEIRFNDETFAFAVLRDGKPLVADTKIGLRVDGKCLCEGAKAKGATRCVAGGKVQTGLYKRGLVDTARAETFVDYGDWGIRFAARNDGVAYRYELRRAGKVTVDGELAGFTIPGNGTLAYINENFSDYKGDPFQNSWESENSTVLAREAKLTKGRIAYLPMLFKYADGTALCVTESDLAGYPGLNIGAIEATDAGRRFEGAFAKFPKVSRHWEWGNPDQLSDEKRLRSVKVLERESYLCRTSGTRAFPWRCFLVAETAAALVGNDLVWSLAESSRVADVSWIKPGKVAWDWWNCFDNHDLNTDNGGCTTKTYERFIDFAAKSGVEYVIFDEGWSEKLNIWKYHPLVDVPHLIDYANKRGVGIILWMAWSQAVGDEEHVAEYFSKLGAKGFKVDFMDRDDAQCVEFLRKFADACARHRMVVDYHGMFKPTGMERTWPNVLNFEGVHGLEQAKWFGGGSDFPANDIKVYFVRMTAGPMDYTPGAMDNYAIGTYKNGSHPVNHPGSIGTRCRQMAMMAMYYAPLQMLCDSPTKYEREKECFAFMAATPVVWDDTVGLAGDPDEFAVCARRKGKVWYAAGMADSQRRAYALDTSFLGGGEWKAEIFRDGDDADVKATSYIHEFKTVRAGDRLTLGMARGGGFVVRFSK